MPTPWYKSLVGEGYDPADDEPQFSSDFLRSRGAEGSITGSNPSLASSSSASSSSGDADWFDALLAVFGMDGKREKISTTIGNWAQSHYVLLIAAFLALVLLVSGTIGLGVSAFESQGGQLAKSIAVKAAA